MNIKNIMLSLLLVVALSTNGWAQNLVENFDGATCGTNDCLCCIINFIDNSFCLPGWAPSHGSPNTINNEDVLAGIPTENLNISGQAAMMFGSCAQGGGEGLFTDFNFEKEVCYEISFLLSTDRPFGSFDIFATSNLEAQVGSCCGTPPSNMGSDLIRSIPLNSINTGEFNSWATVNIAYSPEADFDQFLFFPTAGRVIIDNISISEICPTNIIFTSTQTDIPAGNHHASNLVSIGSFATSGFIDSDPNNTTELRAGNSIRILDHTSIVVNGSNHFLMEIEPCTSTSLECTDQNRPYDPLVGKGTLRVVNPEGQWGINSNPSLSQHPTGDIERRAEEDIEAHSLNNLDIYPNPSKGQFKLKIPVIPNNNFPAEVMIYNQFGKLVYQQFVSDPIVDIDLSQIPSGIYIVNAKVNDQTFTERLIIQ